MSFLETHSRFLPLPWTRTGAPVHRTSGKHHEVTTQGLILPRLRFGVAIRRQA
jgi:hypothetical protein